MVIRECLRRVCPWWTVLILVVVSRSLFAHGNESHAPKEDRSENADSGQDGEDSTVTSNAKNHGQNMQRIQVISRAYQESIEPIFAQKCLPCHGSGHALPWYSKLPGAKQMIQRDIREAKKHMDMSQGFPFAGHGSIVEDLEALKKSIEKDSMPPLRYRLMHWDSGIKHEENERIIGWIEFGLEHLNQRDE